MIELTFNGQTLDTPSVEQLGVELDSIDAVPQFELWVTVPDGPAMCMLRNQANAWLMYLRGPDDDGVRSSGDCARAGLETYRLSNGQVDEYPLSWCVEVEQCYKAISYFYVNDGAIPNWITWQKS